MRQLSLLFVVLLLAQIALAACTPAAPTPGAPAPTVAVTAGAPPSEQPPATAEPQPTATTEPAAPAAFCPEIARPALILFMPTDQLVLFDPAGGASCPLPVPGRFAGMVQLTPDAFFSPAPSATGSGDALVIQRYLPDGAVEELPSTRIASGVSYTGFTVSGDSRLIAWGLIAPEAGSSQTTTRLRVASLETGAILGGLEPEADDRPRAITPIRFDEAGDTLFYTVQPYGIGGSWISFNGRYDNLYAIAADLSGEPQKIFDCADKGLFLCLGDFFVADGNVAGLAYVDREAGAVIVENDAGELLNTLPATGDYVGYPTWGPTGELVYYTATLAGTSGGPPTPAMGNLQRVAPPTAPAETVAADPALALPVGFLDDSRVVVNWVTEAESGLWGLALAGIDGVVEPLDVPAGASVAGIAR